MATEPPKLIPLTLNFRKLSEILRKLTIHFSKGALPLSTLLEISIVCTYFEISEIRALFCTPSNPQKHI